MSTSEDTSHDSSGGVSVKSGLPGIAPDKIEQELGDPIDNGVPTMGYRTIPMVGLGGSAGGIAALRAFFAAMPSDTGMTFVVILHLSPAHESTLAELLGRLTTMRVVQAADNVKVEANCVYVIPPGKHLTADDGHLRLTDLERDHGKRVAIDLFFRSLADSHGPRSAAIILSGADGDGTIGIKRIKERGGLTIAQDPDEAEHSSMPRSAIATGMIDWVLKVSEMPARLLNYQRREALLKLPPEEGPQPAVALSRAPTDDETALRDVLVFLKTRTGRDFSYYKRATILRRISRRMQVNSLDDLPSYLSFLRTNPGEAGALLKDLLISVTNFFRDRDSFEALETQIPALFKGKRHTDTLRVWVPACATGEEAYSIAILLLEHAATLDEYPAIQVFGSDLDQEAIQAARSGTYPETIAADVSTERLRRFFTREHRGFRVRREVREVLLFAAHDLLKDAPFSRLDLISCRNLLIYLNREAQQRAFDIFNFALKPDGRLFLGSSESVEDGSALFSVIDKKHRLYRHHLIARTSLPVPAGSNTLSLALALSELPRSSEPPILPGPAFMRNVVPALGLVGDGRREEFGRITWKEAHFKLIERFAPPSVIVNAERDILHLSENAGRFLHFGGGEPTMNLLHLIHPGLRVELRATLFRAEATGQPAQSLAIPADLDGDRRLVDIRVLPAQELAPGCMLVIFDARERVSSEQINLAPVEHEPAIRELEKELELTKHRLGDTVEQYEASTEELKASNEELQAMNEELRSATEELETSREELQSINEELTTVNLELKTKVEELGHANSDLHNLMASTSIATVFLDRELKIMLFTPPAAPIFHLIQSDLGRPLSDLQHPLAYPELPADAERVLRELIPIEREAHDGGGRCFLARLRPYRTPEERIAGVVLTFVDISERKQAEAALRESEERFRLIVNSTRDFAIVTTDEIGIIKTWNPAAESIFGSSASEVIGQSTELIFTTEDRQAGQPAREMATALRSGRAEDERWHLRRDGSRFWGSGVLTLLKSGGAVTGFAKILRDLTEVRLAEDYRRDAEERFRVLIESVQDYAIFMLDAEGRVTSWNQGAEKIKGYTEAEAIGKHFSIFYPAEANAAGLPPREMAAAIAMGRSEVESWRLRKSGEAFWANEIMMPLRSSRDRSLIGFAKITRDLTQRKIMEDERSSLLASEQAARLEAEAAIRTKDTFLAMLSHELRTPLTPVLMATETLLRRKDLPPLAIDALEMILRNVEIEAHFIDDLLDLTRISRGKLEISREAIDIHQAIKRAVEISQPDFLIKNQNLTFHLDAKPSLLLGDSLRLQQVFWNLLKNASKFTPEGGSIEIRSHAEPEWLVVQVSDNGMGIDPSALPTLFEAFRQEDVAISRQFGGLGLGLAISKATVEALGGTIAAASGGRDKGTTVTVKLPLQARAQTAIQ